MRVLLSSVGTRGDVPPIVALGLKVRDLGHEVRLCVPPNLVEWARGFGLEALPIGVEMRQPAGRGPTAPITAEQLRRLRESMPDLITDQFYWASRVRALGIGTSVVGNLTIENLSAALREALEPAIASHSRSVAQQLSSDGAMIAARKLVAL